MRLLQTEITPLINDVFHIDLRNQPFLSSPHTQSCLHAHPELELVLIVNGFGKRIIGNKVEPFESGDMVFIGSYVPHVWLSDATFYEENSTLQSTVLITYFNPTVFQQFFDTVKEFDNIKEMIVQASRGIRILGETRNIIAEKLKELSLKKGFEKVDGFLQIMHLISICKDKSFIVNNDYKKIDRIDSDRMIDVIKFVKANLSENISLKQVAEIACMTEQSFCRFFKSRSNKNFFQYLKDLRMEHASELLIKSSSKSISDIALQCGFGNSSHFSKTFKDHYGQSPHQYRVQIDQDIK
ncbi:MAG: AraC family transcriptional regulator [Ferruginibacter sp.]